MLTLVFLTGFLLLNRISQKFSMLERIGFALPTGLLLITLAMAVLDWANLGLTPTTLGLTTATFLIGAATLNISYLKELPVRLIAPFRKGGSGITLDLSWFNLLWLLMLIAVAYLEAINYTKCLMYPTYDRDSMAAFDTIGYICAQEYTFHGMSIFDADYFPRMHQAGSSMSYLPMVQLAYAYVYSFGSATSKAIPAFIYLSFLIGFYGLCRRRLTHTASMLALTGIILTPEMTSFASHSITNVMQACMASTGILYACLWIKTGQRRDLWMSAILLAANNWMRAEGIVFIGVAWIVVFAVSARRKQWRDALIPLTALVPLVLWTLYSSACGLTSESAIITHPYWDEEKASTVVRGMWLLLAGDTYYGWTFHFMAIAILADLKFIFTKKSDLWVFLCLALCIAGYYLILYQVDYKWDNIYNVLAYSAKRFNFCFVPIAWYIIIATYPMRQLAAWIENKLGMGQKITFWRPTDKKEP